MATREQVKAKLEKIDDDYLEIVYRLILSLEAPSDDEDSDEAWRAFIASTYGSLAEAPIERGPQGEFEVRNALR